MLESELEPITLRYFYSYTNHLFTWSFTRSTNINIFLSAYDVLGFVVGAGLTIVKKT